MQIYLIFFWRVTTSWTYSMSLVLWLPMYFFFFGSGDFMCFCVYVSQSWVNALIMHSHIGTGIGYQMK